MARGDTAVTICSQALLLLGQSEISSFTDGTQISGACGSLYPDIKAQLLSMYNWSFCTKKEQLAQLSSTPVNEWTREYQLPSDIITGSPQAVYNSASTGISPIATGWEILGDKLQTDEATIVIDYIFNVNESLMPQYFVQLLKYAVAAHLAEAVTDQITKAEYWHQKSFGPPTDNMRGGYFRQACHIDGRGRIPQSLPVFPLTDVRV